MARLLRIPCALTIAGSDSGGGAGIQADLKTLAALGVHGCSAITCVTAQNPDGVRGIQACTPRMVRHQIDAALEGLRPAAAKTGMLFSAPIIEVVADVFQQKGRPALVVDPVMVATSGARLLRPSAIRALERLLPLATLITPNLDETAILVRRSLESLEHLREAARELHERFGCGVLVKGGHLAKMRQAVDVSFDGKEEHLLRSEFVRGVSTHGTGCTYSAAIAGYLARGCALSEAIFCAKRFITRAIAASCAVGQHSVLNPFWRWSLCERAKPGLGARRGRRRAEGGSRRRFE